MDDGIDQFRAPFDCKVKDITNYTNNTVVFQSIVPVELPIGTFNDVCFRCTHMDKTFFNKLNIHKDQVFRQGETCYYEGSSGEASGNHIHIEFALGKYNYLEDTGNSHLRLVTNLDGISGINNGSCNLYLPQAVFIDPSLTTKVWSTDANSNYYSNQYTFTLCNGVPATNYYLSFFGTNITGIKKSLKMVLTGSAARIRENAGPQYKELTLVPKGSSIEIYNFYSWIADDGYRWCWGTYNGVTGAFQYDPNVMHPEGSVGTNTSPYIMMKLDSSAARIRINQVGDVLTTAQIGDSMIIDEFNDSIASDGYRWVRVRYSPSENRNIVYTGWIQYDSSVMHPYSVGM